jgi:hypothetical protein
MDGILDANLLTAIGPLGVAFISLVVSYFLWQRQTQEFTDLKEGMKELLEGVKKTETEQSTATATIAQQNAAFQIEIASTRPTRKEMNEALDRMTGTVRDLVQPMRDDIAFIKNAFLKGQGK